jgi:hypothetical protein
VIVVVNNIQIKTSHSYLPKTRQKRKRTATMVHHRSASRCIQRSSHQRQRADASSILAVVDLWLSKDSPQVCCKMNGRPPEKDSRHYAHPPNSLLSARSLASRNEAINIKQEAVPVCQRHASLTQAYRRRQAKPSRSR